VKGEIGEWRFLVGEWGLGGAMGRWGDGEMGDGEM